MPETRRLNGVHVFALWTAVGLLLALETYLATAGTPRATPQSHVYQSVWQIYRAWLWALLTPCVFALRRTIEQRYGAHRIVVAVLHVVASLALLLWCNVVRAWALHLTFGGFTLADFGIDRVFTLLSRRTLIDFYLYWVLVAIGYMRDLNAQKRASELRAEQLRTQLAQAELAALKQQVQPHFLFNSLNAVASLMREGETARAIEALALLSTLLRQLINHAGRPEIELWRELDYAQCYLSVEKVRFEDRLVTHFDADEDCLGAFVPTLILQPLVENAVKHGIAQRRNPGRVTVTARHTGDRLRLQVTNDPAEGGARASEHDNHGLGLRATRARLERAFGPGHLLNCTLDGPQGTVITIELPLRLAPAA